MGRGVLLEAMPGATLRALGLPFKGYKGGKVSLNKRGQILQWLARRSGISLPNLWEFHKLCLSSHDCLDAIVAAVISALWCTNVDLFRHPKTADGDLPTATSEIEGWLYAPVYLPDYSA